MPRRFPYQGPTIAFAALPDADPNTTPPAANRIFDTNVRANHSRVPASAVQYAASMNAAGTVDITPWIRDVTSGVWLKTTKIIGATDKELIEIVGLPGSEVFLQLTNPAGFATVVMLAEATP